MDSASIALGLAILGVNFGWQPTNEGPAGYEYTVQIEPEIADLLRRGDSVPIESNVPPEVAPIRKVKIVVGRGELTRTAVSQDAQKHEKHVADANDARKRAQSMPRNKENLIVRGQSPDDMAPSRSASAWTPPRSEQPRTNPNFDRYGNPRSSTSASAVQPPPGFGSRVGGAVDETAHALRDGLEAGFAEANEQLSRTGDELWQSTRGTTQNITQQLQFATGAVRDTTQQTLGAVSTHAQQRANQVFGVAGTQPPPPLSNGNIFGTTSSNNPGATSAPSWSQNLAPTGMRIVAGGPITRTTTGWTSVASNIAAPPVMPPLGRPTAANVGSNNTTAQTASSNAAGPSFPGIPPTSRDPLHTQLMDPWSDRQSTGQAVAGRPTGAASSTASNDSGLIPIRPVSPRVPEQQQAAGGFSDPWHDKDPWKQPAQSLPVAGAISNPATATANQNNRWSKTGTMDGSTNWGSGALGAQPGNSGPTTPSNNAAANNSVTPSAGAPQQPAPQTQPLAPVNNPASANAANTSSTPAAPAIPTAAVNPEVPWRPLLFVSLGLVCSLSANLFLGWSYMDARQRYVSLVRKTAHSFRRRASEAA